MCTWEKALDCRAPQIRSMPGWRGPYDSLAHLGEPFLISQMTLSTGYDEKTVVSYFHDLWRS